MTLGTDLLGKTGALAYFAFWDPETREQADTLTTVASSSSAVLEDGQAVLAMRNKNYSLTLFEDAAGRLSAEYADHEDEGLVPSRLCLWEDGALVSEERQENGNLAAVVVRENGRYCAMLCSENICESMLIRMMVCEDESIGTADRLGAWYGDTESEPSGAERRIDYGTRISMAVQVWEIRETE